MKTIIKLCGLIFTLSSITFTGCATITSGTTQSVVVITEKDVINAECKLTDKKGGTWHLPHTPGAVRVQKGDGPMTIVCNKEGYKSSLLTIEETLTGTTFGNILLGGGIGILIDTASGAAQQYPDKIIIWMEPAEWDSEEDKNSWLNEKEQFSVNEKKKSGQTK